MAASMEKGRDLSDDEKIPDREHTYYQTRDDIPDPDAGLSEEERAAHVRCLLRSLLTSTHNCAGSQTALEAGCQAHPMAVLFVPNLILGSHEYR